MSESVIFEGKADSGAYSGTFLFLFLFTLCSFGLVIIFTLPLAIWVWIESRTNQYKITSERIEIESGLFSTSIEATELWRIRDIKFQRGMLEKLTDGCTITLVTQDLTTPSIRLKCFTHKHGRSIFQRLQPAISEARKNHKVMSVTA